MIAKVVPPRSAFYRVVAAKVCSSLWILAGLLVLSEAVYVSLVRLRTVNTTESVLKFLAAIAVLFLLYGAAYLVLRNLRCASRKAMLLIVCGAILFRVTLLFAGLGHHQTWKQTVSAVRADIRGEAVTYDSYLLFDNDIWRYLWDGHVAANGVNPYLFPPASPALDSVAQPAGPILWGDIRANVNYADVPTIYPPLAQGIFRYAHALAPGSVFVMKVLLVAFDLGTVLLVGLTLRALRRPVTDVVLYAWNPLIVKAVAGSGHVDVAAAMFLAATVYCVVRRWGYAAAACWGLSVVTKLSPFVLLPLLVRRIGWRKSALGLAVVILAYAPYLDSRGTAFLGLRTFASEWQFNSGFFRLVEWLAGFSSADPVRTAKIAAGLVFLLVFVWLARADDGDESSFAFYAVSALAALMLLSPTVMPWYLVWIVPLAVMARLSVWIQFSALVCVSFLVMVDGAERAWVLWAEYGITAVLCCREYLQFGSTTRQEAKARPEGQLWSLQHSGKVPVAGGEE